MASASFSGKTKPHIIPGSRRLVFINAIAEDAYLLLHEFDAAIAGAAFERRVVGDGLGLAVACCRQSITCDAKARMRALLTNSARRLERSRLNASSPCASVCPSTLMLHAVSREHTGNRLQRRVELRAQGRAVHREVDCFDIDAPVIGDRLFEAGARGVDAARLKCCARRRGGAVTLALGVELMCYHSPMHTVSYHHHRFPAEVIEHAVWLDFRFPLSFRDVEDLLAQRGIDVSYETVRRWSVKFGLAYARKLRRSRSPADNRWHLDEIFVSINGKTMYLWRAVDCEGEVLDVLVQSRRNKKAALKLMRKLFKTQGFAPTAVVTDKLPSYGAALSDLGMKDKHITGKLSNNRAEKSHLSIRQRERRMQRFKSAGSA